MTRILNEHYLDEIRASKSENQFIKINDKWLLDTSMGAGTHLFGHGAFIPTIKKYASSGLLYIVPNKIADECGELLHETTKFNKFAFCNTGSEATLRCIRIARAYTSRSKIMLFNGCWHGTHDWNLALYSEGIPQSVKDEIIVMSPTDEAINRLYSKDIAIVMIEPIQSSLPIDRSSFLLKLKKACDETNTVLCFDEVISGFRSALGGASEYFGIRPDIAAYGKILGGGLPIGVVGGNDVMDVIGRVRMGGTFSANPLTMYVCRDVLRKLIKHNPYKDLHKLTNELATIKNSEMHIVTLAGMSRILFTNKEINTIEERDYYEIKILLQLQMIKFWRTRGIYINNNKAIMLSMKHTLKDIIKLKEILC